MAPWFGFHTNFEIRPGRCQQPRAQSRAPARDAPPALPTDLRPHRSDARSARRRRRETRGEHDGSRCAAVSSNEKTRDPHPNRTFGCRGLRTARARSASREPPTAGAQTLTPPFHSPRSPGVAPGAREPDQRRGAPRPANLAAQRQTNNLKITLARTHHDRLCPHPIGDGEAPPTRVHGHAR